MHFYWFSDPEKEQSFSQVFLKKLTAADFDTCTELDVAIHNADEILLILLISETVNEEILSIKKSLIFALWSLLNCVLPL